MAVPERFKDFKLPDETAPFEAHVWDHLLEPYPSDACKDLREWIMVGPGPVLILNDKEVEVVTQKGVNPKFCKWRFRSRQSAKDFCEMMLPHSMVVGLM